MKRVLRVFGAVLSVALVVSYPLLVYVGATRLSGRGLALAVLLLATVGAGVRASRAKREHLAEALRVPATVIAVALLGALFDDRRAVMFLPTLVNVALLVQFGGSLRGMPLVERFARMQEDELSPAQVRYCRTVTQVWCGFFVLNGGIAAALATTDRIALWSLYTGVLAYVAMGTLGTVEYLVRKWRFRIYGDHLVDRILSRVFPPRAMAREGTGV